MENNELLLPHSADAEECILGNILLDPGCFLDIENIINSDDFYNPINARIFNSIRSLLDKKLNPDVVSVADELGDVGIEIDDLTNLLNKGMLGANVENYAQIIRDNAIRRKLILAGKSITKIGFSDDDNYLEHAESEFLSVINEANKQKASPDKLYDILVDFFESDDPPAIKTGYYDLDKLVGGFRKSDLIVIAASTSIGKSAVAVNLVRNFALQYNIGVLFYSLEMSKKQVAQRFVAIDSGVNTRHVQDKNLTVEEMRLIGQSLERYYNAPIYIDDNTALTTHDLLVSAKKKFIEHPDIGVVVVDYLQLMQASKNYRSEVETISEISRSLKLLAKELNRPVIALSQLNREVDHRSPPIPVLADLRSSGAIGHDSDMVIMLYREDRFDPETDRKNIIDLFVRKNRMGPVGQVSLYFDDDTTRLENFEELI